MSTYKIEIREIKWQAVDVINGKLEDAAKIMYDALGNSAIAQVGRISKMVGIGRWQVEFKSNADGQYIGID